MWHSENTQIYIHVCVFAVFKLTLHQFHFIKINLFSLSLDFNEFFFFLYLWIFAKTIYSKQYIEMFIIIKNNRLSICTHPKIMQPFILDSPLIYASSIWLDLNVAIYFRLKWLWCSLNQNPDHFVFDDLKILNVF